MKIISFKELESGGAELEADFTVEEQRVLIELGFTKLIEDVVKKNKLPALLQPSVANEQQA